MYSFEMYIVTHFGDEKALIEALEMDKVQLVVGIKRHHSYDHQFTYIKNEALALICSNTIDIPKDIEKNDQKLINWLQNQTWFIYSNDQDELKKFWDAKFNVVPKIIPRHILPSYIDIIEALKINNGFSIVPKHLCEHDLMNNVIKSPLVNSPTPEQKRYYSYKLKNSNLKVINQFIEEMKKTDPTH